MIGCRGGCPCEHYACHDNTPPDLIDTHLLLINPKIKSNSKPANEQIKWNLVKKKTDLVEQPGNGNGHKDTFVSSYHGVDLKYPASFEGQRSQGFSNSSLSFYCQRYYKLLGVSIPKSHMCSFTNHGHMYLAGGTADNDHNRRLYKIEGYEIIQLDDIPFDFG